jgi:hypothetical protein
VCAFMFVHIMLANLYSDTIVLSCGKEAKKCFVLSHIEMLTRCRFENDNVSWHEISSFPFNSTARLLYLLENNSVLLQCGNK